MKKVVLIVTVGRLDLKIVARVKSELTLVEVSRTLRAFHEALLNQSIPHCFYQGKEPPAPPKNKPVPRIEFADGVLKPMEGLELEYQEGRLVLFPAKLWNVVQTIRDQGFTVVGCIVFNTHRNHRDSPHFLNEPIAAGPLIARWLAGEFSLRAGERESQTGPGISGWIDYLAGDEEMTGDGRDYPVNRLGLRRIDAALHDASRWENGLHACLSTGGGMPNYKDQIFACAQYRFANRVFDWHEPEQDSKSPYWMTPQEEQGIPRVIPAPAESFRHRRHAGALVKNGDFSGAYAVAQSLEEDDEERKWIQSLYQAHLYMLGMLTEPKNIPPYLKILVSGEMPRCLMPAMRLEAALWSGRILEAIFFTSTFFDAALLDWIEKSLIPRDKKGTLLGRLNQESRTINFLKELPFNKILMRKIPNTNIACLEPSKKSSIFVSYSYHTDKSCLPRWFQAFPCEPLERMSKMLNDEYPYKNNSTKPRFLRNIITHSDADQELMNRAKEIFIQGGFWAPDMPSLPGSYFLRLDYAKNILNLFDIPDPAALYQNLVHGLLLEMENHEIA